MLELLPGIGVVLPSGAGTLRFGATAEEAASTLAAAPRSHRTRQCMTLTRADYKQLRHVHDAWLRGILFDRSWNTVATFGNLVVTVAAGGPDRADRLTLITVEADTPPSAPATHAVAWDGVDLFGHPAQGVAAVLPGPTRPSSPTTDDLTAPQDVGDGVGQRGDLRRRPGLRRVGAGRAGRPDRGVLPARGEIVPHLAQEYEQGRAGAAPGKRLQQPVPLPGGQRHGLSHRAPHPPGRVLDGRVQHRRGQPAPVQEIRFVAVQQGEQYLRRRVRPGPQPGPPPPAQFRPRLRSCQELLPHPVAPPADLDE
ncbi:hypothetical protein [Kitasatospora griseola]|uniref:hypothetical protein n=1 Tax=Kitasatospora griseola TaxID=2064 RepID=UPI00380CB292